MSTTSPTTLVTGTKKICGVTYNLTTDSHGVERFVKNPNDRVYALHVDNGGPYNWNELAIQWKAWKHHTNRQYLEGQISCGYSTYRIEDLTSYKMVLYCNPEAFWCQEDEDYAKEAWYRGIPIQTVEITRP